MRRRPLRPSLPPGFLAEKALQVPCPSCKAPKGQDCKTTGLRRLRGPHGTRVRAYKRALRAAADLSRSKQGYLFDAQQPELL